ncbi:hypothetical protein LTR05_002585 [Lithohypha guttulata]|uniref:Uncharacterized protein n=1 Tax=Lithohypha guttulata TaxID=1690604 RepID=A0AAN7T451_9EURO|nr:hypothetical protein LTR05_002585 [Lithohypha guttulata]
MNQDSDASYHNQDQGPSPNQTSSSDNTTPNSERRPTNVELKQAKEASVTQIKNAKTDLNKFTLRKKTAEYRMRFAAVYVQVYRAAPPEHREKLGQHLNQVYNYGQKAFCKHIQMQFTFADLEVIREYHQGVLHHLLTLDEDAPRLEALAVEEFSNHDEDDDNNNGG